MTIASAIPPGRDQTSLAPPPRLLDVLQQAAAERGHSAETIRAYGDWTMRFIVFHGKRHPRDLTNAEVGRFLGHVAQTDKGALRTIEAARTALDFLYREVLHLDRGELPWAKPPRLLDQVRQVLRVKHYSPRTEDCYVAWIHRYIVFHGKRHPRDIANSSPGPLSSRLRVYAFSLRSLRCHAPQAEYVCASRHRPARCAWRQFCPNVMMS
jgi:hypothetical protein